MESKLLTRQAIIASGTSKNAQRFLANCTRGIVFLGTPHRGSKASLQAKISRIVRHFSAEQRGSISLPSGRSGLWDQLNTFPHMMDKFHIEVECFYEASSSQVRYNRFHWIGGFESYIFGIQVVEEAAATMGRGERTHALNTTHIEMCRFEKPTDPGLQCIVSCIKRFCTLPQDIAKPGRFRPKPSAGGASLADAIQTRNTPYQPSLHSHGMSTSVAGKKCWR